MPVWVWVLLGIPALYLLAFLALAIVWFGAQWRDLPLHPPPRLPASNVRYVPLTGLDTRRLHLTDVDATLTPDGRLHVVWGTYDARGHPRDASWYARSDSAGAGWSSPSLLDTTSDGARLAVAGAQLHAFVPGERLRHLVAVGNGSWTEEAPLGRDHERPGAFDVIADDSGMVVAYVTWTSPDSEADFADKTTKIVVADIRSGGRVTYHDLAQFGHREWFEVRGPRLMRFRDEIHVVVSVSPNDTLRQYPPSGSYRTLVARGDTLWIVERAQILGAYRKSSGGAWSVPRDLVPAWGGWASGTLATAATDDRLFIFYMWGGLQGLESTDGRHWTGPVLVTDAHYIASDPAAFAASAEGDGLVVTWIDTRLGWAQHLPDSAPNTQAESDVFAIRNTARRASLASLARSSIVRVTPRGSFLLAVAATSGAGRHELAWVTAGGHWGLRPEDTTVGVARLPIAAPRSPR